MLYSTVDPEQARLEAWLRERHEEQFRDSLTQGTQLLSQRRPEDALPFLERAHKLKPDHPEAALNLGGAYIMAGKYKLAVSVLEVAVSITQTTPSSGSIWGRPIWATQSLRRTTGSAARWRHFNAR